MFSGAEFRRDPYPTYARLRAEDPLHDDPEWGLTFLTRYADVASVLRDRRFGRDIRHLVSLADLDQHRFYPTHLPNWYRYVRGSFMELEPPAHTRLRALVGRAFSRRAAESYRPVLEREAARRLDAAVERGRMEVIDDYATPIPLSMISELLGIPAEDRRLLLPWSRRVVRLFDADTTAADEADAEKAATDFAAYLAELIADRRRRPRGDLTTALVEAEVEGVRLSDEDLIATCMLVLNAGHEATVHAIGNAVLALARHPEQYRNLRREPALVSIAVEELLRFDAPLQLFDRWVLEDLELHGRRFIVGDKVGLLLGAANRDPEQFESPDELDLGRADNPHMAFGAGIHFCVGAPLARLEMEVAVGALAVRVPNLDLAIDDPPRLDSLVFRGLTSLPVTLA